MNAAGLTQHHFLTNLLAFACKSGDPCKVISNDPMLQLLQSGLLEVEHEVVVAERQLLAARETFQAAKLRRDAFRERLPAICAAAGLQLAAITQGGSAHEHTRSESHRETQTFEGNSMPNLQRHSFDAPLALPSKPKSLRWYAGQVLHLEGEMSISDLANEMRRRGYEHGWTPANSHQLEQSLAALPNQVPWIARGKRPGRLLLDRSNLTGRSRR